MADRKNNRRAKVAERIPAAIDQSSFDLESPIMQGYLFKRSHAFDSFNKRYFVLYPKCLVYYEKKDIFEKDVKHGHLENRHGHMILNRVYLTKPDKKPQGGKYCFNLHIPDPANKRHEILLVSKTKDERRDWMIKLQQQNPNLLSPDIHVDPDTPLPTRKQTSPETPEEVPNHLLLVPSTTSMSRNVSFDETILNVQDDHSDYEDSVELEMTDLDKGSRSNDSCETNLDEGIRFGTSCDIQVDAPSLQPIVT